MMPNSDEKSLEVHPVVAAIVGQGAETTSKGPVFEICLRPIRSREKLHENEQCLLCGTTEGASRQIQCPVARPFLEGQLPAVFSVSDICTGRAGEDRNGFHGGWAVAQRRFLMQFERGGAGLLRPHQAPTGFDVRQHVGSLWAAPMVENFDLPLDL